MYIHEDNKPTSEDSPSDGDISKSGRDIYDAGDEILDFLPSERPVSAAEYACWHSLVRHQLSASMNPTHTSSARGLDLQLAQACFEDIGKVHSCLNGESIGSITDP